ncbi:hypothetical protein CSAL01_05610 [Colletotrichum salicis]|uniref:Ipa protein n=1 Tax=Colletotrichum salicis TaxID=1209931 RepID=A0A135V2X7_9PEZI|nr:hypothetical protein CSAL01_05610 [Colletotrichum salicis]
MEKHEADSGHLRKHTGSKCKSQGPHDVVTDLHDDLVRKYKRHGATIQEIWKGFNASQRAKCVKVGVMDGVLRKHSRDTTLGNVCKIVPDWNLRDLTEGPEHLLNTLEHRAKKTLMEQYCDGPNGGAGDHGIIDESMRTRNLRHVEAYKDCYTIFVDGEIYGQSWHIVKDHKEALRGFEPASRAGLHLISSWTIFWSTAQPPKKSAETGTAAFSKLSVKESPAKLSLADIVNAARDQAVSQKERLELYSEPVVLAHDVNFWFFSRPEVLPDEKGRRLPVVSDKFISASVSDIVHNAVKEAALWSYIHQLLERFESMNKDKAHKTTLLQEIANTVQLAYASAQALFKRHVQSHSGSKWYKRMSNAYDGAGNVRVMLKGNPGDLTRSDPQLHYILRLCHPDATSSKAVEWLQKLGDLHQAHPEEREKLVESEFEALCDLATRVAFIRDADLDLRDFAVPIDELLEPGMTVEALKTLDQFIVDNAGARPGVLYKDLAKIDRGQKEWTPLPVPASEPRETLVEQRKQKEKTRPAHVSAYEAGPQAKASASEPVVEKQTFKITPATAEVFDALFKKSETRGAVHWTAFEGAMAELGFSVLPKYGSVFTFMPPNTMTVKRPFTIHRPHKSQIEGYTTLIYSRRLARAYGWDEKTFVAA